jgi:hypothetical protein
MSLVTSANIPGSSLSFQSFQSRITPGVKALYSGPIDFTSALQWTIDLTSQVNLSQLQYGIQSIYVDCSNCLYCDTLITVGSQSITCKAGSAGYYPVILTGAPVFVLTNYTAVIFRDTYVYQTQSTSGSGGNACNSNFNGAGYAPSAVISTGLVASANSTQTVTLNFALAKIWFLNVPFVSNFLECRPPANITTQATIAGTATVGYVNMIIGGCYCLIESIQMHLENNSTGNVNSVLFGIVTDGTGSRLAQQGWSMLASPGGQYPLFLMSGCNIMASPGGNGGVIFNTINSYAWAGFLTCTITWRPSKAFGQFWGLAGYDV